LEFLLSLGAMTVCSGDKKKKRKKKERKRVVQSFGDQISRPVVDDCKRNFFVCFFRHHESFIILGIFWYESISLCES
jgi:hypothetical protein